MVRVAVRGRREQAGDGWCVWWRREVTSAWWVGGGCVVGGRCVGAWVAEQVGA